jgi:hypothetical protein
MRTFFGYLIGEHSNPIPGSYVVVSAQGQAEPAVPVLENKLFVFSMEQGGKVTFSSPGYKTQTFVTEDWGPDGERGDVALAKAFRIEPWAIIAVMSVVLLLRRRGKVGKFGSDDVKTIFFLLGGILGLTIVTKILRMLGLLNDPKDERLDAESGSINSPWNSNYWKNINPSGTGWTFAFTESQAGEIAKRIWDAIGFFGDKEAAVIAAIHEMRTRANLSFVAWVFAKKYNRDLLEFIRYGGGNAPWAGLSDADVTKLNQYIYSLPTY